MPTCGLSGQSQIETATSSADTSPLAINNGLPTTDDGQSSQFIDSHCHLDDPAFDADRDAVIERARAAGIKFLLSIGGSEPETFGSGIALADRYDWIYTTVGLHPHEAKRFDAQVADSLQS